LLVGEPLQENEPWIKASHALFDCSVWINLAFGVPDPDPESGFASVTTTMGGRTGTGAEVWIDSGVSRTSFAAEGSWGDRAGGCSSVGDGSWLLEFGVDADGVSCGVPKSEWLSLEFVRPNLDGGWG